MPYETEYQDYWQSYDPDGDSIQEILNKLIGQQQMIRATIQEVREDVEGQIEYNRTMITQTADEIRQEVYQGFEDVDVEFNSVISQTATAIRAEVEALGTSLEGDIADARSYTEQTALGITQQVELIETNLSGEISDAWSQIDQNANAITNRVSYTDYTGNNIVSMINQTASSITIAARKIDFSGLSTFTVGSSPSAGRSTIFGGSITLEQSSYALDLRASGIFFATGSSSPPSIVRSGSSLDIYAPSNIDLNGNVRVNGSSLLTSSSGTAYDSARLGGFPANTYSRTNHNHGNSYIHSQVGENISLAVTSSGVVVRRNGTVMGNLLF